MGQGRDQDSIAKAELVTEGKERKEENHTIFFTNNDADKAEAITDLKIIENMNKMQSTLNCIVRDEGTNFGRQCLRHHYVLVYVERMRRKSCQ